MGETIKIMLFYSKKKWPKIWIVSSFCFKIAWNYKNKASKYLKSWYTIKLYDFKNKSEKEIPLLLKKNISFKIH